MHKLVFLLAVLTLQAGGANAQVACTLVQEGECNTFGKDIYVKNTSMTEGYLATIDVFKNGQFFTQRDADLNAGEKEPINVCTRGPGGADSYTASIAGCSRK